ncbi:MAG: NAD-dependent epimerase/dehydratase family protein, partial [Alphaproteobacteria bacterium]
LALCILRLSSIYGAGLATEKMISKFLQLAASGEEIALSPPTGDRINLVHAADVARAILAGLDRQAWGCFNIAAPSPHSIWDIAQACVAVTGNGSVIGPKADGGATSRYDLDCSAAREHMDFEAAIDLSRGLDMTWRGRLLD